MPCSSLEALTLLSQLYTGALTLSELEVEPAPSPSESCQVLESECSEARARAGKLDFQYYGEVFDPHVVPPEDPAIGDLSDDLADIYSDLKTGLNAWDCGERSQALWHWRFTFESHWGEHATSALRALHMFVFNKRDR